MNISSFLKPFILVSVFTMALAVMANHTSTKALANVVSFPTYEECEANYGGRITICHATSSETNPYVEITIACEALYGRRGNAGHLEENGTTQAGHEDDILAIDGECPGNGSTEPTPNPSSSPSTSPEPSPSIVPSPSPTATPEVEASPSPSATAAPSPAASPQVLGTSTTNEEGGNQSSLGYNAYGCTENTFEVSFDVTHDGQPDEGVSVTFTYLNQSVTVETNAQGRAQVSFTKQENAVVTASAPNYPSQQIQVVIPESCAVSDSDNDEEVSNGTGGGSILGASTDGSAESATRSGSVLGATTLADTGAGFNQLLTLALHASVMPVSLASLIYASKK